MEALITALEHQLAMDQQRIMVDHQQELSTNQQRLAQISNDQDELATISGTKTPDLGTRILVPESLRPGSWYQDPGTKISSEGPKTKGSELK